ncbi:MAG: C4-type zinc ribbon domain-containing protein [Myxococcota bacterium]|nr:C4-type zinc ribbon domain-containing protein [Myxococcota bacterium]
MALLEGLQQLIDLQQIDDELDAAAAERGALPDRRVQLAAEREAAEQRVVAAVASQQEAEQAQRAAEVELADKEALVAKLEGQQFQVKSNEAYSALLREIEEARAGISGAETTILEAMENIEAAGAARERSEEEAKAVFERVSTAEGQLDTREKELGVREEQQSAARVELCTQVPGEMLSQYERIAGSRRPAVAMVRQEICQGCRTTIPPQLHVELLRMAAVITCTHCRRILVPEPSVK